MAVETSKPQAEVNKETTVIVAKETKLDKWIIWWFYATALICTWDASFIMFRPHSFPGGSLSWIWYTYKYYVVLDQRYLDMEDDYVFTQSLLNYAEVILNIVCIVLNKRGSKHTITATFMVTVMTMWKTVLYLLMFTDFCTGSVYRQGNQIVPEIILMFIPNAVWVVIPLMVMANLWAKLSSIEEVHLHLNIASTQSDLATATSAKHKDLMKSVESILIQRTKEQKSI